MIDPLIKVLKTRLGDRAGILYNMDDLKASTGSIEMALEVHVIVKGYAASVGMAINNKKRVIQMDVETPLPEPLQDIPRLHETTCKYLGFEMKNKEVDRKGMMAKLEERMRDNGKNP